MMAAAATTAVRNQRIAPRVGVGPRYTAVPDGESAFSPLIMRTTTVGPVESTEAARRLAIRRSAWRVWRVLSQSSKRPAARELKFELQRASGLELTPEVPV